MVDKQKKATETVVAQAELLGEEWANEDSVQALTIPRTSG